MGRIRDARTCVHMEVHMYTARRRAITEIGRLRHWAGMNWVLYAEDTGSGIDALLV